MKRWQRGAVIAWVVLVAGGGLLTFFLGDRDGAPLPTVPSDVRPSSGPLPSSACQGVNVICGATFMTAGPRP